MIKFSRIVFVVTLTLSIVFLFFLETNISHAATASSTFSSSSPPIVNSPAMPPFFQLSSTTGREPYGADSSTVALWTFDQDAGNLVVDSTGVNNGTAAGQTGIVDGRFGKARSFRGQGLGDYISVPDNPSLRNLPQMTIEAWIFPD